MRRKTLLLSLLGAAVVAGVGGYLYLIKFDIRREQLALHDASRNRDVPVELAISRRAELKAKIFGIKPRVAIVNHGNTVKATEYSFVGDVLATQGYLVAAIQHDLPGDPALSMQGFPFVGRLPSYQRAEKNILFAIGEIKKHYPDPDFETVTMLGHSHGGDITMYFAGHHPELVTKVVTLDNIRVPLLMSGKARILSFRSNSFKADPGVVPSDVWRAIYGADRDALPTQSADWAAAVTASGVASTGIATVTMTCALLSSVRSSQATWTFTLG